MPKKIETIKAHNPKVVEKRKLSDGAISFRIRCCADPSTDSWHTVYFTHHDDLAAIMRAHPHNAGKAITGPAEVTESFIRLELEEHKARVARLHDIDANIHQIAESFVEAE